MKGGSQFETLCRCWALPCLYHKPQPPPHHHPLRLQLSLDSLYFPSKLAMSTSKKKKSKAHADSGFRSGEFVLPDCRGREGLNRVERGLRRRRSPLQHPHSLLAPAQWPVPCGCTVLVLPEFSHIVIPCLEQVSPLHSSPTVQWPKICNITYCIGEARSTWLLRQLTPSNQTPVRGIDLFLHKRSPRSLYFP